MQSDYERLKKEEEKLIKSVTHYFLHNFNLI